MPTQEEIAHAVAVLQAMEMDLVQSVSGPVALTPATVLPGAPVAEAVPSEPVKTEVAAAAAPLHVLLATRNALFLEMAAAYFHYGVHHHESQHQTDAEIRAFDAAQLDKLHRALAV